MLIRWVIFLLFNYTHCFLTDEINKLIDNMKIEQDMCKTIHGFIKNDSTLLILGESLSTTCEKFNIIDMYSQQTMEI